MPETAPKTLSTAALTIEDATRVLTRIRRSVVVVEMLQTDIEAGALVNAAAQRWFGRSAVGGESRDIWTLGPFCIKRWSPRIPPAEVRHRCRVSRAVPVCNPMWYVRWLHWSVARRVGAAITIQCNHSCPSRYSISPPPILLDE